MISNDDFQVALIAQLKADSALTAWLNDLSAGSEIREAFWQGDTFVYPAVRAGVGTQVPQGNGVCYLSNSETPFSVFSFSEKDSGRQANQLAKLVNAALVGKRLSGSGFRTLVIASDGLLGAVRTGERVWRATGLYRCFIHES